MPKDKLEKLNFELIKAIDKGDLKKVKELLKKMADPNCRNDKFEWTALILAAIKGELEIARLLIENGADVNGRAGISGMTALMYACENGDHETAELLLEKGADISAKDGNGDTVLDIAMEYCKFVNNNKLVMLLQKYNTRV